MSDSLQTNELQQARLLCPPLSPRVCLNSCPLSQWCYPAVSSSAAPFSFCLLSFPASGSFPKSWLFTSGGQSIGASASASALPGNIQGWFSLVLTGLIFFRSQRLSKVFPTPLFKSFNSLALSSWSDSHIHTWLLEKTYLWLYGPLLAECYLFTLSDLKYTTPTPTLSDSCMGVLVCSTLPSKKAPFVYSYDSSSLSPNPEVYVVPSTSNILPPPYVFLSSKWSSSKMLCTFIYLFILFIVYLPTHVPRKNTSTMRAGIFFFFFTVFSLIYPQHIKRCLVQNKSVSDEWIDENGEV